MRQSKNTSLATLFAVAALSLAGCLGGGGGSGSSTSVAGGAVGAASNVPLNGAILTALQTGDAGGLTQADAATLLQASISTAKSKLEPAIADLTSIYSGVTDLSLDVTRNSAHVSPSGGVGQGSAIPLIISDSGKNLASIQHIGNGHALAYSADVLKWMSDPNQREQQHFPFFLRAFKWVVTGSGDGTLPATIKFAVAGYDANSVKNFITRAGGSSQTVACAVADPANTCWKDLDLIVFGGETPANPGLTDLVKSYLAAGKSVIYIQPLYGTKEGRTQVLKGMDMVLQAHPGNFFAKDYDAVTNPVHDPNISVSASRTLADVLKSAGGKLQALLDSLTLLSQGAPGVDIAKDPTPVAPFLETLETLRDLGSRGVDIFRDDNYQFYRMLVLWADVQRTSIAYHVPNIQANGAAFMRTYATDSFVWYSRATTTAAPGGQGDFMPASVQTLEPSSTWEEIDLFLPNSSGLTLIGRAALPAKGVEIEIVDSQGANNLAVQIAAIRGQGDPPVTPGSSYDRPIKINTPAIPFVNNAVRIVSPNGGPLSLQYGGANDDGTTMVRLRIKGVVKYAHFDFVHKNDAEIAEATAALNAATYAWASMKIKSAEILQLTSRMQRALTRSAKGDNTRPPRSIEAYAAELQDGLFISNHTANGYNDGLQSSLITNVCNALGWACDDPVIHKTKPVQRIVSYIAQCGVSCSGSPIDSFFPFIVSWGSAHELGHNTVQRVFSLFGCQVECNNNNLSSAVALRVQNVYPETNIETRLSYKGLYQALVDSQNTGLTGDALINDMNARIWAAGKSDWINRAVHFQLAYLFARHRVGQARPTWQTTLDYFALLNKGDRLVAQAFNAGTKDSYGMGRYATNSISNHDLVYVLASRIIGRDMRKIFAMYGIPLSANALGSIADLNLPVAPMEFYALTEGPQGQKDGLDSGQWLDLETNPFPSYPNTFSVDIAFQNEETQAHDTSTVTPTDLGTAPPEPTTP